LTIFTKILAMTLIKSISGIRGIVGDGLSAVEIVQFASAYTAFIKETSGREYIKIVVGRDARVSGKMVSSVVCSTLKNCKADVINLGLATTPTVEMAVVNLGANGGIIITASHNPAEWNALKLLNSNGEFLSAAEGQKILDFAEKKDVQQADLLNPGKYQEDTAQLQFHINQILALPLVNVPAIRKSNFKVAFDAINSVGGIALPALFEALGVLVTFPLNATPDGLFAHNPEPLPEHLRDISMLVKENKADVGFVVDPDVDRLAIIMEDGGFFGEEYTLVAIADYILSHTSGNTVSNLSSTRALRDVTEKHGGKYYASAVGEVNVVEMMKKQKAVIGGEGNGGVIYPELHYGRDALVGIALFLSQLAISGQTCSELRHQYPDYFISKNKVTLKPGADLTDIFARVRDNYQQYPINAIDGLKVDFEHGWVHLRQSNTEPIIRIYAEGTSPAQAEEYAGRIIRDIAEWVC
jgi:phosphomannomutase